MRLWHSLKCLHRRGHPVDQNDLVAPVELIGLAGRETERDVSLGGRRASLLCPGLRVAPDRVVAALITKPAKLLEKANQRQPLPPRLPSIRQKQLLQPIPPRPNLRHRLNRPLVAKLRRLRPDYLPDRLPRDLQLPADRLDGFLLLKKCAPDLRNRLHDQHPKSAPVY